MPRKVIYKGKLFESMALLARHLGMNRLTVAKYHRQLRPGQDFNDVIHEILKNKNALSKQIKYKGRSFKTIKALATQLNISEPTLSTNLDSVQSGQDATPIIARILRNKERHQGHFVYRGQVFETRQALEKRLGVSPTTLRVWMKGIRPGGDCTRAINEAQKRNDHSVAYNGVRYKNVRALANELGISKATLHTWKRKGLSLQECVKIRTAKRFTPELVKERSKLNWSELTIEDVIKSSPWNHKLMNIDFSKCHSAPDKRYKIFGLICNVHGPLKGHRWLGGLKLGNHPCRACSIEQRKSTRGAPWTMARVKKIVKDFGLPISLSVAELSTVKTGKKTREERVLINAHCTVHSKKIGVTRLKHLMLGKAGCSDCYLGHYSEQNMADMIFKTHGGLIRLNSYSGKLTAPSTFHCTVCKHDWASKTAVVLGNKKRRPSGCPRCKLNSYHEGVVAQLLEMAEIAFMKQAPCKIEGYNRPLRSDFYLPTLAITIECDGEQHYMPIDRTTDLKKQVQEFKDIQRRDLDKRDFLKMQRIRTCRIPFWVKDVQVELSNILAGSPTFPDLPADTNLPDSSFDI